MTTLWYDKLGEFDRLHYGDTSSFFVYRDKEKFIPLIPQYFTLSAVEGSTMTPSSAGGEVWSFIPTQAGRRLADVVFYCRLPALTLEDGDEHTLDRSKDYLCYQNDIAHRLFTRIELVDGSDVLDTIYPEIEHFTNQVMKRNETRQTRDLWGWYDSVDDLNDRAASAQDLYWTVPFHFVQSLDRALRIDELVSHDLRMRFYWNGTTNNGLTYGFSPDTADNSLTPASISITNVKLYLTYYPLAKPERAMYRTPAIFRTLTYQRKAEYRISSSTNSYVVPLTNFSYPVCALLFRIRSDARVTSPDYHWDNVSSVDTIGLSIDGQKRFDALPARFWQDVLLSKTFPSLPEEPGWYFVSFNPAPMLLPDIVAGSFNFSQCNEANLEITMPTGGGVNGFIDIWAFTPNFIEYKVEGDRTTMRVVLK